MLLPRRRTTILPQQLVCLLLVAAVLLPARFLLLPVASADEEQLQATWTPNPEDDAAGAGPLPLPQQQRQQLRQLEQAIVGSPDPAATLERAAAANGMDPGELASLLERNHRDLEAAGGGGGLAPQRPRPTNIMWKLATALAAVAGRAARKHPRSFAAATAALVLLAHVLLVALPRTGIVVSSRSRTYLTAGPTTWANPPARYVQRRLRQLPLQLDGGDSGGDTTLVVDPETWRQADRILPRRQPADGWAAHRSKQLKQAVSFQTSIDLSEMLNDGGDADGEDDDDGAALGDVAHWSREHAAALLRSRDSLTEWADARKLRLVTTTAARSSSSSSSSSNGDEEEYDNGYAILVVEKLGDWGRYGLLPLCVTYESTGSEEEDDDDDDDRLQLVLTTLKGAHFDGQIHIFIDTTATSDDDDEASPPLLQVTVRLLVPKQKKCKAPSLAVARSICQGLAQSVAASVRTRTRQSVARAAQSHRYGSAAGRRARERRHRRGARERALEEMAADRRRRWQRSNPNAGSYRPSGHRMKSPNNAVY